MSFGMIGGAIGATVVGSALSGGGSASNSSVAQPFINEDSMSDFRTFLNADGTIGTETRGNTQRFQQNQMENANQFGQQAINNQGASDAGFAGRNMLASVNAFDPMAVAQQQFGLFNPIMQEQFEQDRLSQENRLFAQGQTGSTAGANQTNALLDSQRDAERKLLFDSFGQGMQAQNQQVSNASALMQLDPQLRGLFQNLAQGASGNSLAINDQELDRFNAFAAARGGSATQTSSNPSALNQIGSGLVNAGVGQISTQVGSLFNPSSAPTGNNNINGYINPVGR